MPPKRYFKVSHDLLTDPEYRAIRRRVGRHLADKVLPVWLYLLAGMDRSENHFAMPESAFDSLEGILYVTKTSFNRIVEELIVSGWITVIRPSNSGYIAVNERSNSGYITVFSAPTYHKYHKTPPPDKTPPNLLTNDSLIPLPPVEGIKNPLIRSTVNGSTYRHEGETLISFLNEKTGKQFQARTPNGEPTKGLLAVELLLKKKYTAMQIRQVIANRCRIWGADPSMHEYLRPETLFRVSKFQNYVGELGRNDAVLGLRTRI